MIKEFRENIDFKEFREIFDDLSDDEFVDLIPTRQEVDEIYSLLESGVII